MSLRLRLTVLYGGLFLLAGGALLGVTYLLFTQQVGRRVTFIAGTAPIGLPALPSPESLDEQARQVREAAATSLLAQGAIALGGVAVLAAGLGWLVAGRALAPLRQVTDTARRIAAAADPGVHSRIALRGPDDEVKDLADAFDVMVERLDRSFDAQRRFVANASHELRTPLTLNRSLVEVAMHRRTASDDVRQLGGKLLQINARHEKLISGLLLLAKSESALTERCPVDLAAVVAHVVPPEVTQDLGEATALGDALMLERLAHNLVENALRHNVEGGWVRVTTRSSPGRVELEVANSGPVIPPAEVPALFDPFHRRARVAAEGAGLGLSIVRSVAHAHGGEVTATARPEGGLVVVATLPAA
ncbi:two-component sensor histidine kinase [Amycolatopsis sp. NBRC 101858]|uniref:sensor histidine kinase n=1 Tax=Amycolatopsis sp. NBRC 101858 TaxID=3032200 RepID=UPI0024A0AE1B|nr:ATP-binding protein [Amycolatopsis sp. NBRC 101858]GLY34165.1 two-component sensor histidine kinase [Amycolatopsis sp. NBRC 101858]